MSAERIDVLAVYTPQLTTLPLAGGEKTIAGMRRMSESERTDGGGWIRAADVAELIEADKEYDTARSRYDHAFRDGSNGDFSEQREALAVLREAKKRRAAALARMGEGA